MTAPTPLSPRNHLLDQVNSQGEVRDETITAREFQAYASKPIDLDADGVVSEAERGAYEKAREAIEADFRRTPDLILRRDRHGGWGVRSNPRAAAVSTPEQRVGRPSGDVHSKTFATEAEAEAAYRAALARLLDVGNWASLGPAGPSAEFRLVRDGQPVAAGTPPEVGDRIGIGLPGVPWTNWVEVTRIDAPEGASELAIQVRPSPGPGGDPTKTEHMFDGEATNTFGLRVLPQGDAFKVQAYVIGRNELSNRGPEGGSPLRRLANQAISRGGAMGPQAAQWDAFTRHLLGD